MKIYTIPSGVLQANSYLVTQDKKTAVLIDCGGTEPMAFAKKLDITIEYVLLTHGHFDHILGCSALQGCGAKIGCCTKELSLIDGEGNLASEMGLRIPPFSVDFSFEGGQTLSLCGMEFEVIETPGNTPGGVTYRCGENLFTGDTLFLESIGRTDFPGGSMQALVSSVRKLLQYPNEYIVYPGHDDPTSVGHEKDFNPYAQ